MRRRPAMPGRRSRCRSRCAAELAERGDTDGYRFEAKKGLIYAFEVVARRAGSECDPVLRLLDRRERRDRGRRRAGPGQGLTDRMDSSGGRDLCASGRRPARPRGRGVRLRRYWPRRPSPISPLTCDPDMINVGPGGRVPVFVRVARRQGFSGAVELGWEGLPAGCLGEPARDLRRR